ncbi:NAD(P)-dependent oxidoreductase [Blastococcus brunescens]|uniref:NAD(P)-dependent oxidoreductase n=1 Tax=Blastococcus brunescens TaxID=1564165 RepID=A0ABZ1B046_9ACTN|nr:NAD(P)-dependent oxidoreductase [Blastococcus sp. BMG 8361]WRL64185.1 NAD(P)-dependent oxidoreductase [Blastococcus sp. BMG 8361]
MPGTRPRGAGASTTPPQRSLRLRGGRHPAARGRPHRPGERPRAGRVARRGLFEFLHGGGEVKRLHPGKAARDGIVSAELAVRGLTGPTTVLEGPSGYFRAFADDDYDPDHLVGDLGGTWRMLGMYVKPYPCCRHLHGPIDAILALQREEAIDPDAVDSVRVETFTAASRHGGKKIDEFLDAQMSIPYAVAVTMLHGIPGLEHFGDEYRDDPGSAGSWAWSRPRRPRTASATSRRCVPPASPSGRTGRSAPCASTNPTASPATRCSTRTSRPSCTGWPIPWWAPTGSPTSPRPSGPSTIPAGSSRCWARRPGGDGAGRAAHRLLGRRGPDQRAVPRTAARGWRLSAPRDRDDEEGKLRLLADADVVVHTDSTPLSRAQLDAAPRLRLLHRQGVGLDAVDLELMRERDVAVALCSAGTASTMAEHTVLLILAASRHLVRQHDDTRRGLWPKWEYRNISLGLDGSTVGIVGFGRIGQAVARAVLAFGSDVLVHRRTDTPLGRNGQACPSGSPGASTRCSPSPTS